MGFGRAHRVGSHVLRLYDTASSTTLLEGMQAFSSTSAATSSDGSMTDEKAEIQGILTLAASTTFKMQHICTSTHNTTGLGIASSLGTQEIYADLLIERIG